MHRTRSKNLGKLFRFSKNLPEAQARLREGHIAPSAFSPRQGAGEFLLRRKPVGRRSDRSRKQPEPGRAADYAISPARLRPAGFSPKATWSTLPLVLIRFGLVLLRPLRRRGNPPDRLIPPSPVLR